MATMAQSVLAPHAAHKEERYLATDPVGSVGTYTPESMPPGATRVVNAVRDLFRARFMRDFCEVMPDLSRDVVVDAPFWTTSRKGHLRVGAYLARFAAGLDFEPALVNVKRLAGGRHLVEITGTVRARPHRTWLLLPTLLLPASIPVRATIKAGVAGSLDDGKIDLLWGRWHNLPPLPSPARLLNGLVFGAVPHALEPAWGRAMEFFGDDFYKRKRERSIADGTAGAVDTAIDLGSTAANTVGDVLSALVGTVMETAHKAVDTTRQYADTTAAAARDTAQAAADMAAGAARSAYETVAPASMQTASGEPAIGGEPLTAKARAAAERAGAMAKDTAARAGVALDPSGAHAGEAH